MSLTCYARTQLNTNLHQRFTNSTEGSVCLKPDKKIKVYKTIFDPLQTVALLSGRIQFSSKI